MSSPSSSAQPTLRNTQRNSRPRRRVIFVAARPPSRTRSLSSSRRRRSNSISRAGAPPRPQPQPTVHSVLLEKVQQTTPLPQPEILSTVVTDLQNAFIKVLSDPGMLTMVAIVTIAVVSHTADLTEGPLAQYINTLSVSAQTLIRNNAVRLFGLLIFIPALWCVPSPNRVYAGLLSIAGIFILPPANVYIYTIYSVKIYLYNVVEHNVTRLFITVFGVIFYIWFQATVAAWPHPYVQSSVPVTDGQTTTTPPPAVTRTTTKVTTPPPPVTRSTTKSVK